MEETRRPTLIVSVQRALHLMETVAAHPNGAPAKQLARQAGLPLATAYHLLRTLVHEGYVTRLDDGLYVIGGRVGALHRKARPQGLFTRVRAALHSLRDELRAAAYLALFEDGEIRLIDIADGPRTPRVNLWVGFKDAAHATAIGKCVLAQLGPDARRDYLARHPLVDLTPHTITERVELERRLNPRLALDREEYALGTVCAAVPVSDGTGTVVGALAVSACPARLAKIQESVPRLHAAAIHLARALSLPN